MKKAVFLFLTIFTLNALKAQKPHFGFKGGLNVTNLVYKNADGTDYKAGFHAGLVSHIHAAHNFAIQPEVFYSQQGGIREVGNDDYKLKLNYINVPVLAQYMFGKGYRIEAGPQVGFLLNAKDKYKNIEVNNDNYKAADWGLAVGFGYLSHSQIGVDLRWVFGLNNINKARNGGTPTYNNGAQLGLFYQFDHRGLK